MGLSPLPESFRPRELPRQDKCDKVQDRSQEDKYHRHPITPSPSTEDLFLRPCLIPNANKATAQESPFWKLPWELRRRILELAFFNPDEPGPEERFIHVNLVCRDSKQQAAILRPCYTVKFHDVGGGRAEELEIERRAVRASKEANRWNWRPVWFRAANWNRNVSGGLVKRPKIKTAMIPRSAKWLFDEQKMLQTFAICLSSCRFEPADFGRAAPGTHHQCPLFSDHRQSLDKRCEPAGGWVGGWLGSCRQAYIEGMDLLYSPNTIFQIDNPTILLHAPLFLPLSRLANVTSANITLNLGHWHIETIMHVKFRRDLYSTLASRVSLAFPRLKTLHLGAILDLGMFMPPSNEWKYDMEHIPAGDQDVTSRRLLQPIDEIALALQDTLRYFVFSTQRSYHSMALATEMRRYGVDLREQETAAMEGRLERIENPGNKAGPLGFSHIISGSQGGPHALIPDQWYTPPWRTKFDVRRRIAYDAPHAFWRDVLVRDEPGSNGTEGQTQSRSGVQQTGYWVEWCGHFDDTINY